MLKKQAATKYGIMPLKELVLLSFLASLITVGKLALAAIPNIEIVSFLFVLYTVIFGAKRSLIIAFVFATIEILIWGIGVWTIGYYLFWPLLIGMVCVLPHRLKNIWGYTFISGLFGFLFGLLFAIYSAPLTGISIWVYWMNGIMFDVVHMIGNIVVMLILYSPGRRVLKLISNYLNI